MKKHVMGKRMVSIGLIIMLILGMGVVDSRDTIYAADVVDVPITVTYGQTEARSIYNMINEMRTSSSDAWYWNESNTEKVKCTGLSALTYNYDLERVAMKRAAEIALSYGHSRPNESNCFSAYYEQGISFRSAGENIAAGYSTAESVNKAWREDNKTYDGQGHRRNMLSNHFNSVGVGHVNYNGRHYWVEEFGYTESEGNPSIANDSNTVVSVQVADQNILGYTLEAAEGYKSNLQCGQKVTIPKYEYKIKIAGYWGSGSACPTNEEVTYSLIPTDIATLEGRSLSVVGQGNVELVVTVGGLQGKIAYRVSHNKQVLQAKKATEYETGLTEGSVCAGCKAIIVQQQVIPKLEKKPTTNENATNMAKKKFKIDKTKASLKKGKTLKLKVSNAEGTVKWSSSNKKIATVNSKGVVTAKRTGKVTIKAYCPSLKKTVKCKVEVYQKLSQSQVTKKIRNLKSTYKEGRSWTNEGNYYFWSAINTHCYGCIAFVGTISDKVFGKKAKVTRHTTFSKIKAGDHIRIGDYHSVIVLSKSGDELTVVEGNYNSSVHWGRVITKSELQREGFYVETRY